MTKLYGFAGSPNTWKVRALAHHIGATLEYTQIDFSAGEQKTPAYLAMNPTARTPVLVDGDFTLWESTAIMHYLAEHKPGPILAQSARERAEVLRWQSWQLQHWGNACTPYLWENVAKSFMNLGPPDPAVLAKAAEPFATEAKVLDQHLAKASHLVADRLTIADFSVASYLVHSETAKLPLAPYANINRWSKVVLGLPCWAAVAPKS